MEKANNPNDLPMESSNTPVTGWHLATTPLEAVTTEFEWALLRWYQAFDHYTLLALNMLGFHGMTTSESLIMNIVRLHDRPKPANMIASLLNREDIQNVQYSLRKLLAAGLIVKAEGATGKNANLMVTNKGRRLCDEFASLRRQLLITHVAQLGNAEARLLYSAKTVSMLTGLYDEVGRTSTAYILHDISPDD